jgi:hypothetical protein
MRAQRTSELCLILLFLGILVTVPVAQTGVELWRGDRIQALDVFRERPTSAHLRAYERQLEDESVIARNLRPFAKFARFAWFKDGGDKAVIGRDGWLFYGPGLDYITRKPNLAQHATVSNALSAIIDFRDQLTARGIQLVVMPAPNKESIYPEKLLRSSSLEPGVLSEETRGLLVSLERARVPVVNLFELFASARRTNDSNLLYLTQDSHWSPLGLKLAASTVSQRLLDEHMINIGTAKFDVREQTVERVGDILRMLRIPLFEDGSKSKPVVCEQVMRAETREVNRDLAEAQVLILGDSFLRIFQQDEPGAAGFVAHLARDLKQPIASIINDGGASTLVRQELNRRAYLLANKKVVIWEFVERDIRFGTEGWQKIRLPENKPSGSSNAALKY